MKPYKIIVITSALLFLSTLIHSQTWQWAKQAGSNSLENISSICTDSNGDVYIYGQFGAMFPGPGAYYMIFDNDTVFNNGVNQIFLAKYSANGNLLWVKGIGGNNPNIVGGSCIDCEYGGQIYFDANSNSLLITGIIYGTASFGSTNLSGLSDLFLSKIDLNGNFIWAKLITCNQNIYDNSIATDLSGNIFICGFGADSITFDSITIQSGGFIAEYDSSGNIIWAKKELDNTSFLKIIYTSNNLFVIGNTISDTTTIDTAVYISTTYPNVFLSRLNTTGNVLENKFIYSAGNVSAGDMSIDNSENLYIAGDFHINAIFGTDTLFNSNSYDMFFVKYDPNGNLLWKEQANASNSVGGGTLKTSTDGNTYIAGGIQGNATFGSFNISSVGSSDMFVARYDDNGNCLGVQDLNQFYGLLSADNVGNYFIAGEFSHTLTIGSTTLTAIFGNDIFLAKHDVITGIGEEYRLANNQLIIYANPSAGKCNITIPDDFLNDKNLILSIYDNTGKLIQQKTLEMTGDKIILNLEEEAMGVYNVRLSNGHKTYNGKIVFE